MLDLCLMFLLVLWDVSNGTLGGGSQVDCLVLLCIGDSCLGFSSVEKVNLQLGVAVHACYPSTKYRQEDLEFKVILCFMVS